jgi:hypothetical protein
MLGNIYYDVSKDNKNPFTHVDVGNPKGYRPYQGAKNGHLNFWDEYNKRKTEIWTKILYNTYKSIYHDVYDNTVDNPFLYHEIFNR